MPEDSKTRATARVEPRNVFSLSLKQENKSIKIPQHSLAGKRVVKIQTICTFTVCAHSAFSYLHDGSCPSYLTFKRGIPPASQASASPPSPPPKQSVQRQLRDRSPSQPCTSPTTTAPIRSSVERPRGTPLHRHRTSNQVIAGMVREQARGGPSRQKKGTAHFGGKTTIGAGIGAKRHRLAPSSCGGCRAGSRRAELIVAQENHEGYDSGHQ